MELSQVGLIGLGVMGSNLALNLLDGGFSVSVFNRSHPGKPSAAKAFVEKWGGNVKGFDDLSQFAASLERPRKIILMVKAGEAVDEIISALKPFLEDGDIIIDGGNSDYRDTARRVDALDKEGILFVGTGISGGEEGARHGASIMVGGNPKAWTKVKNILQSAAAKNSDGTVCCKWIGEGGAGHFVKMVHNGIEYADMQLISEAYFILKNCNSFTNEQIAQFFEDCESGGLGGYLIEITAKILRSKDGNGNWMVDSILDVASQKGTGKWTVEAGLDLQCPVASIAAAVFARFASADKDGRIAAGKVFPKQKSALDAPSPESVRAALYASKILAYSQGFALMEKASDKFVWNLDFASIASIWRNGCIIRSAMLDKISAAYKRNKSLNFIFDDYFKAEIMQNMRHLREVVAYSALSSASAQSFFASLSYFDAATSGDSGANLIQAQRDFFGAHTYERVDAPRGVFFHTDWSSAPASSPDRKQIQRISK